jgi:hypothetical protein
MSRTTDLVDVTVSQREVDLVFRDNASIDGDRIRVYLNGVMILDDYTLTGEGYYLPVVLNQGSNEVIIEALNEGEESPNTVEVSMTFVIEGPEVQIAKGLTTGQTISFFVIAP